MWGRVIVFMFLTLICKLQVIQTIKGQLKYKNKDELHRMQLKANYLYLIHTTLISNKGTYLTYCSITLIKPTLSFFLSKLSKSLACLHIALAQYFLKQPFEVTTAYDQSSHL